MQADGSGEYMNNLMALFDSAEFVVLGEPTPEHAAASRGSRGTVCAELAACDPLITDGVSPTDPREVIQSGPTEPSAPGWVLEACDGSGSFTQRGWDGHRKLPVSRSRQAPASILGA